MSEERLKEIKDIIDYQDEVKSYTDDYENLVDLYNEVIRLRLENKDFKKRLKKQVDVSIEQSKTIDKAIEYIEKELKTDFDTFHYDILMRSKRCLLNILRGNDEK